MTSCTNSGGASVNLVGPLVRREGMNKSAALVVPALLLLTLSGCGDDGAGGDGGGSGGAGGASGPAGNTACVARGTWSLDIDDAAAQLGAELTSKGLSVTSTSGEGHQELVFDQEGYLGTDTGLAYTMVVDMGDGLVMTMTQNHEGTPGGQWAWVDDTDVIGFSEFSGDYTVTTHVDINGQSSESAVPLPSTGPGAANMTIIACDDDSMTTQAAGSPFEQHWLNSKAN